MRHRVPSPERRLKPLPWGWRLLVMLALGALHGATGGCATWKKPEAVDDTPWRARAVSETVRDVRLSAAILGAEDSRRAFGEDVNATGIQPVWVEVENSTADTLWLLRAGTDPDYFSPLEVAWSFHAPLAGANNAAIDEHFDALDFHNPIPPGSTRAGIIFANPHYRTRVLNVDLLGPHKMIPFTLFLPDPDNPPDAVASKVVARYAAAAQEDFGDPGALRAALEQLACCAADAKGAQTGDPVNVVFVGRLSDMAAAVVRRGFRSDRMDFDDAQRLFGRRADFVMRKAGQGGVPAYWLRGWVAPFRYQGQLVLVGQVGRPVGGRFAIADGDALVLHPDVDEARNLLVQDLWYSGGLVKLGFVGGSGTAQARTADGPARSAYHTDGFRAVMFFVTRPRALSDIQLLDWAPYLQRREAGATSE
jgi:hypothetical protein